MNLVKLNKKAAFNWYSRVKGKLVSAVDSGLVAVRTKSRAIRVPDIHTRIGWWLIHLFVVLESSFLSGKLNASYSKPVTWV